MEMDVLVTPSTLTLPVGGREVRFAVGAADGLTSNLWSVRISNRGDVYVFCRDNFQDVKASLHQSGVWKFGLTEAAIQRVPSLISDGEDRAWHKWDRPVDVGIRPLVAFRITVPLKGMYLKPELRSGWRKAHVLVPPPVEPSDMTVFSVVWVPKGQDLYAPALRGGVIARLEVDSELEILVAVTEHPDSTWHDLNALREHIKGQAQLVHQLGTYSDAVVLGSGVSPDGAANLLAYPLRHLMESQATLCPASSNESDGSSEPSGETTTAGTP